MTTTFAPVDVSGNTVADELGLNLEDFRVRESAPLPPEVQHAQAAVDQLDPQQSGLQAILDSAEDGEAPAGETPAGEQPPAAEASPPAETAPPIVEPEPPAPPVNVSTFATLEELTAAAPETARAYVERARAIAAAEIDGYRQEQVLTNTAFSQANAELRTRIEAALDTAEKKGWLNGGKELLEALDEAAPAFQEREAARNLELYEANRAAAVAGWESLQARRQPDLQLVAAHPAALAEFKSYIGNKAFMKGLPGTISQQMGTALDLVIARHPTVRPVAKPAAPAPVAVAAAPAKPVAPVAPAAPVPAPRPPPPPAKTVVTEKVEAPTTVEDVLAQAQANYTRQRDQLRTQRR